MEARQKQLIIMYHEIHRLRDVEHFSIQRVADHLHINFRTVKKILGMKEEEFDQFLERKGNKPHQLDPYRDFIIGYLQKYQETPAAVMHDKLKEQFDKLNLRVELDEREEKIGYKIREAQLQKIPYMLIIGDKEIEANAVGVRSRKDGDIGAMSVEDFINKIEEEIKTFAR